MYEKCHHLNPAIGSAMCEPETSRLL